MSNKPAISVIMSVLNGETYLKEAIESVLEQRFADFELIIINDGSSDSTEEIIKSYQDPRIVYIDNGTNLGLSKSFNVGIRAASGTFIARMDGDDICLSHRFEKQISFFKNHPQVDILGSSIITIDENKRERHRHTRPPTHLEIKWISLFSTPLYHPTVMAKSEIFKSNLYDEKLGNSEDYELWSRLLFDTPTKFANILEPLVMHRVYKQSFTQTLNLDKRVVSARNTLSNLKHYLALNQKEERGLIRLRQELPLSLNEIASIWILYFKAARSFIKKENAGMLFYLKTQLKLASLAVFLLKHAVKHPYR